MEEHAWLGPQTSNFHCIPASLNSLTIKGLCAFVSSYECGNTTSSSHDCLCSDTITPVQVSAHVTGFPDHGLSLIESVSNSFFLHHKIAIFGGAESHGNLTSDVRNCFFHAWPFID